MPGFVHRDAHEAEQPLVQAEPLLEQQHFEAEVESQVKQVEVGEALTHRLHAVVCESENALTSGPTGSSIVHCNDSNRFEHEYNISWQFLQQVSNFLQVTFVVLKNEVLFFLVRFGTKRLRCVNSSASEQDGQVAIVLIDAQLIGKFLDRHVVHRGQRVPQFAELAAEGIRACAVESMVK